MIITKAVFNLQPSEKDETVKRLIEDSYPGSHFFIMLIASSVIATAGLILDNASIIIGSMLVAPFLSPVLSLSMGVVMADFDLMIRSFFIILKAAVFAILTAAIFSPFIALTHQYNPEILSRIAPSLPYLYVAIAAGVAASFSITKKNLASFIVGVAISVALLPPLAVTGIGISHLDVSVVIGGVQFFIVNLIGIIFAGLVVFSLMGFYPTRSKVHQAIKKESEMLKKEEALPSDKNSSLNN